MPRRARIYVAGHTGLVGRALLRRLESGGFERVLTVPRAEVDLRRASEVEAWFRDRRPEYVFLAAGTVGGILANSTRPAEFLYDNLMIHANVVEASRRHAVTKLLNLGSACIYPRLAPQPIPEEALLTAELEPTNEAYAVAKIAGLKLCQAYRRQYGCRFVSAMPTNLYGPFDNFDPESSHVVPGLVRKFHRAAAEGLPRVAVWGSGRPRRELLHVDDMADACLFLMERWEGETPINVGTGQEVTIAELAAMIRDLLAPGTEIVFDSSRPDGAPRRRIDVRRLHALGWRHRIDLADGLRETCHWYSTWREAAASGAGRHRELASR